MIKLLFTIPYPELQDAVESMLAVPDFHGVFETNILPLSITLTPDIPDGKYDAIIARGFAVNRLRNRYPEANIITLAVSEFDIFQTILESHIKTSARRVAVVGFSGDFSEASQVFDFLGCTVTAVPAASEEELPAIVRQLNEEGYDAIIGGYSVYQFAEQSGIPIYMVRTSRNTILRALHEVVSTVGQIRRERFFSEMYKSVLYASRSGILFVNTQGTIDVSNRVVNDMTGRTIRGKDPLATCFPTLLPRFRDVLASRSEITDVMTSFPRTGISVSASFTPVMVDENVSGVVITLTDITEIQRTESKIRKTLHKKGMTAKYTFEDIVHESTVIDETIRTAKRYAKSDSNIIIVGESGTGKELFAQSIHHESARKNGPFVAVNCAAIPDNLLESELFGYVDGAFTGATKGGKVGLFEQAHDGTLFLDEVSEITLSTQAKLLRILQERQVRRIGDDKMIPVNVRVISATNRSLGELVSDGTFRKDLMYRLDVLRLFIVPLRERGNDISLLFSFWLNRYAERNGNPVPVLTPEAGRLMQQHPFFGNIRELQNIVERVSLNATDGIITGDIMLEALHPGDIGQNMASLAEAVPPEAEASGTREELLRVLRECGYRKSKAAKVLGIDRSTLWRRLKRYHIDV